MGINDPLCLAGHYFGDSPVKGHKTSLVWPAIVHSVRGWADKRLLLVKAPVLTKHRGQKLAVHHQSNGLKHSLHEGNNSAAHGKGNWIRHRNG